MSTEDNNNYLDTSIHRNNASTDICIYRKPTETGTVIHITYNHPYEQKMAAFNYYINRLLTMPFTEQSKQEEWKTILAIAKNNGYRSHTIHNLKAKLVNKRQKQQQENKTISQKGWVMFTHFSPLIRRITNLFKLTNLKIAFRATNTIQQQI
jgi:hypothetical protein